MAGNKQTEATGDKADGVNKGPDSLSGRSDPADADTGQRQQTGPDGVSNSGHYTGAAAGTAGGAVEADQPDREGGIVSSSLESNVGPAGAPQSSRGSATQAVPGGTSGAESKPGEPGGGDTR